MCNTAFSILMNNIKREWKQSPKVSVGEAMAIASIFIVPWLIIIGLIYLKIKGFQVDGLLWPLEYGFIFLWALLFWRTLRNFKRKMMAKEEKGE